MTTEEEAALTRFIHWFVSPGTAVPGWRRLLTTLLSRHVATSNRIKLLQRLCQTFPTAVPAAAMLQVLSNYTSVISVKYPFLNTFK